MWDVEALWSTLCYRHLGPMSLVLRESRRKTPVTVTLKENERFFGDSAASMVSQQPTPFPEALSREEVTDPRVCSLIDL